MKTRSNKVTINPLEAEQSQQLDESPTTASALEADTGSCDGSSSVTSLTGHLEAGMPQQPEVLMQSGREEGSAHCLSSSPVIVLTKCADEDKMSPDVCTDSEQDPCPSTTKVLETKEESQGHSLLASSLTVELEAGMPRVPNDFSQGGTEQDSVTCSSPSSLQKIINSPDEKLVINFPGKELLSSDKISTVDAKVSEKLVPSDDKVSATDAKVLEKLVPSDDKVSAIDAKVSEKLEVSPVTATALEAVKGSLESHAEVEKSQLAVDLAEGGCQEGSVTFQLSSSVLNVDNGKSSSEECVPKKDTVSKDGRRFNGAQKKRFKWYIKQGYTTEEAYSYCLKPMAVQANKSFFPTKVVKKSANPHGFAIKKGLVSGPSTSSELKSKKSSDELPRSDSKVSTNKRKRKRLSGAQRKRYSWYIRQGHTPEEAHCLSTKPMSLKNSLPNKIPLIKTLPVMNVMPVGNKINPVKVGIKRNRPSASSIRVENKRKKLKTAQCSVPQRRIERNNSHITSPFSCGRHQISNERHQIGNERHQTSNERHQIYNERHRTSNERHQISNERHHQISNERHHQISNERHQTSYICHQMGNERHQISNERHQTSNERHQTIKTIKIVILHANFPSIMLNLKQLYLVQEALLGLIVEESVKPCKPHFQGIQTKPGYLIVNCQDEWTAKWLLEVAPDVTPWVGARIKALPEREISRLMLPEGENPVAKLMLVRGYFPNSTHDSSSKILGFLGAQNDGLDITKWEILSRAEEDCNSVLTLAVDCFTASRLDKEGPWVSYKFGKAKLQLIPIHKERLEESEQPTWFQVRNERACGEMVWEHELASGMSHSKGSNDDRMLQQRFKQRDFKPREEAGQWPWSFGENTGAGGGRIEREKVDAGMSWYSSVSGTSSGYIRSMNERIVPTAQDFQEPRAFLNVPSLVPKASTSNSIQPGPREQDSTWRPGSWYDTSRVKKRSPDTLRRPNSPGVQNSRYDVRKGPSRGRFYDPY